MANKRVVQTATEALKLLWENKFFLAARKMAAIEAHLHRQGYNFSSAELGMALKRAKHLTRMGKHGSYEYIQKYPYVAELISPATKKAKRKI